jgi:hypothetical protein
MSRMYSRGNGGWNAQFLHGPLDVGNCLAQGHAGAQIERNGDGRKLTVMGDRQGPDLPAERRHGI